MTTRRSLFLAAFGLFVAASTALHAADTAKPAAKAKKEEDPKTKIVILDPAEGGIDYKLQGEYIGTAGVAKWGAQVIAMGDGKFHAAFFPGGLPGAGWDAKTRFESEGQLEGDKATLSGVEKVAWGDGHHAPPSVEVRKGFAATLSSGGLAGKADGGESFSLTKTVRKSPAEGAPAPAGAIILFDGSNVEAFKGGQIIADGPFKGTLRHGAETKRTWTDYTLHVEFCLPFKPYAKFQERGNSGVYNQRRYETQVLDSFGLLGYDNECGGVYTKKPADVNMCFPPLTWQTYDIELTAARYENGEKKSPAIITVTQNGVLIQDHVQVDGPTGGGAKEKPADAIQSGVLWLQDHGNPVFYRNIWIVDHGQK